jgi:hypothetical protein
MSKRASATVGLLRRKVMPLKSLVSLSTFLNRSPGQLNIGLILFALWGCATPSGPMGEVAYTHPVQRWSISYPNGWTVSSGNPRSVTFRGTDPPAQFGVHALPDDASKSLDDAVGVVLRIFASPNYRVVSRRSIALPNGYSAVELVHHIGTGTVGKSRKVIVVAKGRAFVIDAETYLDSWSSAEPYFNRMIDSFTVQD